MPSKFTDNYQLNLWDAADKVLHEDFNEDNRKIDAALRNFLRPELIRSYVPEDPVRKPYSIDLTGIDWNEWRMVFVVFDHKWENTAEEMNLPLHISSQDNQGTPWIGIGGYIGPRAALLFPYYDASNPVRVMAFPSGDFSLAEFPFSEVKELNFSSKTMGTYPSGSIRGVRIYGLK